MVNNLRRFNRPVQRGVVEGGKTSQVQGAGQFLGLGDPRFRQVGTLVVDRPLLEPGDVGSRLPVADNVKFSHEKSSVLFQRL